jgi:signal transduction histidine kinase/CheY-like chemotaxis protein
VSLLLAGAAAAYLFAIWRNPDMASPFAVLLSCIVLGFGVLRKEALDALDRFLARIPYGREQATRGLMERLRAETTRAGVAAAAVSAIGPLIRPNSIYIYASEGEDVGRFRRLYALTFGEAPAEIGAGAPLAQAVAATGTLLLTHDLRSRLLGEDRIWLERDNVEVAVPIARGDERLRGLVIVGAKKSGDGYNATDLDVLQDVARCIALALEVLDLEEAKRLSEARRLEAEEADRRKLQFLAHMSHELRTPLHGMLGVTDLLLGTELTAQQEEYARLILRSSESMVAIANDILDLSKLEAGKVQLQKVYINWLELIEDCLAIASERARSESVEFLLAASTSVPATFEGDPHRVRQILTNLLDNAAKYTERGWVIVRVGVAESEVEIQVEDTGPGIRQDLQVRLFTDYEQDSVPPPGGERSSGAGLGLAISKRLAEAMGGRLTFTTRVGFGTKFTLRLPFTGSVDAAQVPPPLLGKEVALVDERPQSTEAYTLALQRLGARVRVAKAPLSTHNLDGCQTAILVHRDDTGSLHSRIRLLRQSTPAPLVILYGGRPPLTATAARAHGVATQLRRPVRHETLSRAVQDAVHMSAATAVVPSVPATDLAVLVVEDDPASARMMELLLRQIGCTATIATNGPAALDLMASVPFSLVFLDYDLPGLNGAEVLQQMRARQTQNARVPVVILSGHAEHEKKEICLGAGADAYLVKPLGLAQLQQIVLEYTRRRAEA